MSRHRLRVCLHASNSCRLVRTTIHCLHWGNVICIRKLILPIQREIHQQFIVDKSAKDWTQPFSILQPTDGQVIERENPNYNRTCTFFDCADSFILLWQYLAFNEIEFQSSHSINRMDFSLCSSDWFYERWKWACKRTAWSILFLCVFLQWYEFMWYLNFFFRP